MNSIEVSSPEVTGLETAIDETLASVFGHGTVEYNRYSRATQLDHGPMVMRTGLGGSYDDGPDARQYTAEGRQEALALLRQAVRGLEEEIADQEIGPVGGPMQLALAEPSRKIFVVHGHDAEARETVARFLSSIGFDPIILHEQANRGRTVIEKVEANSDIGFAVVLLTPDDEGCAKGGTPEPRARQNVLLELGYFLGRLGREKVCALKRGELEIPSDFAGVVWQTMDNGNGWKQALGRELQAAGHQIDWNKVMR